MRRINEVWDREEKLEIEDIVRWSDINRVFDGDKVGLQIDSKGVSTLIEKGIVIGVGEKEFIVKSSNGNIVVTIANIRDINLSSNGVVIYMKDGVEIDLTRLK